MRTRYRIVFDLDSLAYQRQRLFVKGKQKDQWNQSQINKSNAGLSAGQQLQGQATGISGTLLPAYQSILSNPGYSAADKSAITQNTLGGLGASFGAAQDTAMNRTARTNDSAGFGETLDELARERGRQTSTAESGLQEKFADTALSERDKALSGLSNLYGVDTDTMAKLYSPGSPNFNSSGILNSLIGAGATLGAKAIGA